MSERASVAPDASVSRRAIAPGRSTAFSSTKTGSRPFKGISSIVSQRKGPPRAVKRALRFAMLRGAGTGTRLGAVLDAEAQWEIRSVKRTALVRGCAARAALALPFGLPRPLLRALAHLIPRDVAHVRADHPHLPVGIGHAAHAIAPEHVGERHSGARAGLDRPVEGSVAVRHVEHEGGRRFDIRTGGLREAHRADVVVDVEDGVADAQLG